MSSIKKFFEKKKLDVKFKTAGEGKKLTNQNISPLPSEPSISRQKSQMTNEKRAAADAALARLNAKNEPKHKKTNTSLKSEIIMEKKKMQEAIEQAQIFASKKVRVDSSKVVSGIYFTCPSLNLNDPLTENKLKEKVIDFLYSQIPLEPLMSSALLIHTSDPREVQACVNILTRYLDNIINDINNENFRKIKYNNKVLNEKVLSCQGGLEFLNAVGFEKKNLQVEGKEEEFLVLSSKELDMILGKVLEAKEILQVSEPIEYQLSRDLRVYKLTSGSSPNILNKMEITDDFYNVTKEDLKREIKKKEEEKKKEELLMTKELRGRLKNNKIYKFSVIRVRFPDNFIIQATFYSNEKFESVRMFIHSLLKHDWLVFNLTDQLGARIERDSSSLEDLNLVPASLLQISFDSSVLNDNKKIDNNNNKYLLRDELYTMAVEY